MKSPHSWQVLLMALVLCSMPGALSAAPPERVGTPFEVSVTAGSGGPQVEMTFALIHSDVSSYPVTITAISGTIEEQLWEGTLPQGIYRFTAPLTKIKSGQVRVVLKAKITNIAAGKNESFHSYQRWEGSIGAR